MRHRSDPFVRFGLAVAVAALIAPSLKSQVPAPAPPVHVINQSSDPLLASFRFRSIGPASMGGRIDDIAVSESDPSIIYVGYAVGGGLEYAFTPNFTGKIEGLYVNLGHSGRGIAGNSVIGVTNTGAPVTASSVGFRSRDDDFAVVRAGLNYKFNWF